MWVGVILLACPSLAMAQGSEVDPIPEPVPPLDRPHDPFGLGVKKVSYSVGLKVSEIYDNNVFLAADDRVSDYVTVFLLTASARHEYEGGEARVSYRARDRVFARQGEFDGVEHFLTASGTLEPRPFRFEAGLEWRELKDPFDILQVTGHFDTHYDREYLKATVDYNRFDVEVTAGLAHFSIDDDTLDRGDYERWEFGVMGLAEAWAQVALLAEFAIHGTDYDESEFSDFTFMRVTTGARGSLTPKTRTEVRVGIGHAEPDGGGVFPVEAVTEVVARASLTWEISEKQELALDLHREPVESVETGLAVAEGFRLAYRQEFAEHWTARIMASWDRREESDGSGDRRGLQARGHVRWTSLDNFYADLGILVRIRESDDAERDYENLRISFGLGVQW